METENIIQVSVTQKGNPKIILNGFVYNIQIRAMKKDFDGIVIKEVQRVVWQNYLQNQLMRSTNF